MNALGRQLMIELKNCDADLLNDLKFVEKVMLEAAEIADAQIIKSSFHPFSPHGISGMVIIAESHMAIHTWPEHAYAAVDIFTCGEKVKPEAAAKHLIKKFKCKDVLINEYKRGTFEKGGEKGERQLTT